MSQELIDRLKAAEEAMFKKVYDAGYNAAKSGLSPTENPYKPSGHERDTTLDDELHMEWETGYEDYMNG
jgi:hypothetical protein